MVRTLKNISNSVLVLEDLRGLTLAVGEASDGLQFGESALRSSDSVIEACLAGSLEVSDGIYSYTGSAAIDLVRGFSEQLTKDGKRIITASDRPKDHFRYYSSRGDNLGTGERGNGTQLLSTVAPGQTVNLDAKFVDDVYVRDGVMDFVNAELGSFMSAAIVAPIGVPYPVFNKTGSLDFNGTAFVPNAEGKGDYAISMSEEVVFNTFINEMLFVGQRGEKGINSPEPVLLYKPYFLRFQIYNASASETLSVAITMGLYRKYTV